MRPFSGIKVYFWIGLTLGLPALALAQLNSLDETFGKPAARRSDIIVTKIKPKKSNRREKFRPQDSFQEFLLTTVRNQDHIPEEVREWFLDIVRHEYGSTATSWLAIKPHIPKDLRATAVSAQLYLLRKLNLNQTFIDQWLMALNHSEFERSAGESALELVLETDFDQWLLTSAITLTSEQRRDLGNLKSERQAIQILKAYQGLRDEKNARILLDHISPNSPLAIYLIETAFNSSLSADNLDNAANLLKKVMEPAASRSRNPELAAKYNLNVARLLYQAGRIDLATDYYRRIPNRSVFYIPAREELAWTLLRKNQWSELRGEVNSLANRALADHFQPEVFLLRAVSDLKLCMYDQVEKDLRQFQSANRTWAQAIDQALATDSPPPPPAPDDFTLQAVRSAHNIEAEQKQLTNLASNSDSDSPTPWPDYLTKLNVALTEARLVRTQELRRQWKTRQAVLEEAIRKMRFVKVEYDHQLASIPNSRLQDGVKFASNAPASQVIAAPARRAMNFPVDGELWPDELFRLRSAAQSRCLPKGSNP